MITVALPTWKNSKIAWLPMEGLCRQQTTVEWELIVMECASDDTLGKQFFFDYEPRLRNVGCVQLKYMSSPVRLMLTAKWKAMFREAEGDYFCLQGSDDYPHASRNQDVWAAAVDWFDCRQYYHYEVMMRKLIRFDNFQTSDLPEGTALRSADMPLTGFNMAIRTKLLCKLPEYDLARNIDGYLWDAVAPQSRYVDQRLHAGVSTNGANSISMHRHKYYENVQPPFYPTTETIDTIGLPGEIVHRLKSYV